VPEIDPTKFVVNHWTLLDRCLRRSLGGGRGRRGAGRRRGRWRRRSRASSSPPQSTSTPYDRSTRSSEVMFNVFIIF